MKENKYDDNTFFQKYSQMSRSQQGLAMSRYAIQFQKGLSLRAFMLSTWRPPLIPRHPAFCPFISPIHKERVDKLISLISTDVDCTRKGIEILQRLVNEVKYLKGDHVQ